MKKYYSIKYQEAMIRDFIMKHKYWLDYSEMTHSHTVCSRKYGSYYEYPYIRKHSKEYFLEVLKLKDASGMYLFGSCDNYSRIKLWIDDDFYKFTDKRFEQFIEDFEKRNKKHK